MILCAEDVVGGVKKKEMFMIVIDKTDIILCLVFHFLKPCSVYGRDTFTGS